MATPAGRPPAHGPRRQQLPEEVAAYVRELIISGDAVPGEFLRMDRVADAVGVSNTPVREGLLVLRSEGFVKLADTLEQSNVRPAKPSFYGVQSREFQD